MTISFRIPPASARRAERRSRIVIEVRLRWAQPYPRTGRVLYAPAIVGAIRAVMQCAALRATFRSGVAFANPCRSRDELAAERVANPPTWACRYKIGTARLYASVNY